MDEKLKDILEALVWRNDEFKDIYHEFMDRTSPFYIYYDTEGNYYFSEDENVNIPYPYYIKCYSENGFLEDTIYSDMINTVEEYQDIQNIRSEWLNEIH